MGFDLSEDVLLLSQQHAFFAFYPLSTSHPRKLRVSSSSHLRRRRYPDTCAQHVALSSNARSRPPRWRTLAHALSRGLAHPCSSVHVPSPPPGLWAATEAQSTLSLGAGASPSLTPPSPSPSGLSPAPPTQCGAHGPALPCSHHGAGLTLHHPAWLTLTMALLLRLTQPHPNHPLPCATGCR